jgi:hypothetical protein
VAITFLGVVEFVKMYLAEHYNHRNEPDLMIDHPTLIRLVLDNHFPNIGWKKIERLLLLK